jgi:general secretion pathway protein K
MKTRQRSLRRVPQHVGRHQRGVALIIALVLVSLATILAWKIGYDGYLERRRSTGVLAVEQALQFGMGAEALAADALVKSREQSPQDTLAQPWAQPTQALPITSENNPDGEPIGMLQGSLEDMQGRFNLNSLGHVMPNGQPDPVPLAQFERLLASLQLETKWAQIARDWIDQDQIASIPDGAEDAVYTSQTPPYLAGNWPMTSATELMAMPEFGIERYLKLAPYVTALPNANSIINICTASALVIESLADGLAGEYSDNPDAFLIGRKTGCFPDLKTLQNSMPATQWQKVSTQVVESTSYFRLTTHVTLGTTEFTLYSLLFRGSGGKVTPLLRSFGSQ